jgi:hypothetical protein
LSKLVTCPHCGGDLVGMDDGRAGYWRFRVRLYDMQANRTEPMRGADSDEGLEPDQPGSTVARGLWKVASEGMEAAHSYHGQACRGLSQETLERKIRGLRPTLSRNQGRATMRIPYDLLDSFQDRPGSERYLIRIDVEKAPDPE